MEVPVAVRRFRVLLLLVVAAYLTSPALARESDTGFLDRTVTLLSRIPHRVRETIWFPWKN
jgi:hypothetical protein